MLSKSNSRKQYSRNDEEGDRNSENEVAELKLIDAKRERQKIEENAHRLENRVLLLEKERMRVIKKIEDVKKKALEIMKVKQRAQEDEAKKKEQEERKQEDIQMRQFKIQEMRTEQEERLNTSKFNSITNSLVMAKTTKESLKVSSKGVEGTIQTAKRRNDEGEYRKR
jgi:hypothetical protein